MELSLLLSCSRLRLAPSLLPHTQGSPWPVLKRMERRRQTSDHCSLPAAHPLRWEDRRGSPFRHKITVMGRVLSTGENRYRELLSLSASPLSEPGCCQLRMVHTASSKLPTPSSGDGKGLALPTMLSAPYHLPVASGAPLTRLLRDRGNGGSRSREGSRPAQRWSSGTGLCIQ